MMPPNSNTPTQKQTRRMARRKRTECGGEGDSDPHQLKTAVQNQNIIQNFRSPDEQDFLLQTGRTAFSSSLLSGIHRRTTHLTTSKQHSSNLPFLFHRHCCQPWHLVLLIFALIFYCPQPSSLSSAGSALSPASPSNDHPPLHHHHYHHHHHQQQHQLPRPSLEHQQEQSTTTTTTTSTAKWSNSSIAAAAADTFSGKWSLHFFSSSSFFDSLPQHSALFPLSNFYIKRKVQIITSTLLLTSISHTV